MSVRTRNSREVIRVLRHIPNKVYILIALVLLLMTLPVLIRAYQYVDRHNLPSRVYVKFLEMRAAPVTPQATKIAPLFSSEVIYWEDSILKWSEQYNLDPNLLATVMQIESCGHPTVNSYAGAQGLFQVMPFHFTDGENMLDPDTNAKRGAAFLNECLRWSSGDVGLALACYNGGPGVIHRDSRTWDHQVVSYYAWGVPIYADALVSKSESDTLNRWLNAGGDRLCNSASAELGLR